VTQFLASLNWSGPCLSLLKHIENLDSEKPAILHIRHTERTAVTEEAVNHLDDLDHQRLKSTNVGKQAAVDFGASLPTSRDYTLYHTYVDRALETAECIYQGIKNVGGKAVIAGSIPYWPVLDEKAKGELGRRRLLRYSFDAFPNRGTVNWISGLNPTNIMKPSLEFAQELARINMDNLRNAASNSLLLYVSHDQWVLTLMFHWFALLPQPEGLPFLDGFLMQLNNNGLQVWFRDKSRQYEYPYWWSNTKVI
jgi:hypothetical protein